MLLAGREDPLIPYAVRTNRRHALRREGRLASVLSVASIRARSRAAVVSYGVVATGWLALVVVTERWRPWGDAVRLSYATDVEEYETIARAAPGFPSVEIQTPHADRFPVHWTIGELHDLLSVGLHPLYWLATGLAVAGTLAAVHASLTLLRASRTTYALVFGAVAASAYPTRYLLDAPGMLTDALFVLGLAVVVHGFVSGRFDLVLAGLAAATLGRQNGVPLAVVAAVAVALDPRWPTRRWAYAALAVAVPVALYVVPHEAALSWSDNSGRGLLGMTIGGSWGGREGAGHLARCAVAVAVPAALLVLGWVRTRRAPLWAPLALGACVVIQAVALAPDWSHAEPRLAGLGLPALAVAAVPTLTGARLGPRGAVLAAVGIALASFHHLYSNVGVHHTGQWGALVALGCLLILAPAVRGAATVR